MTQQPDLGHALRARSEHRRGGPVGAAVVDEDLLERVPAGERGVDLARERQHVLVFVADGDHDGNVGRRRRGSDAVSR